jgi:hypothetical protein
MIPRYAMPNSTIPRINQNNFFTSEYLLTFFFHTQPYLTIYISPKIPDKSKK